MQNCFLFWQLWLSLPSLSLLCCSPISLREITSLGVVQAKTQELSLVSFFLHQSDLVHQQYPDSSTFKTYSQSFLSLYTSTPSKFSVFFLSWTIAVCSLLVSLFSLFLPLAVRAIFKIQIRSGHSPVWNPPVTSHHT